MTDEEKKLDNVDNFDFDLLSLISEDEELNESVTTEELKAAKKRLPDWDLLPPEGYLDNMKK